MNLIRTFWQSQIGKKIVMALTGLIGVGFTIGHMVGNLQVFEGAEKINAYGRFLHHTLGTELWLVRAVLLAAVVLHTVAAFQLSRQRLAARPAAYKKGSQWEVSTIASRTIRWGGVLLLVFIVLHVLHFTTRSFPGYQGTVTIDGVETVDVYTNLVTAFSNPLWVAFYVVSMAALALHLYHGLWSSARTLGAAKPSSNPLRRKAALALAVVIWAGFTIVPIGILLGLAGRGAATTAAASAAPANAPANAPEAR